MLNGQVMTPPALAKRWGCKPSTVIALIRAGRLAGFNLGHGLKRPRYRIAPEAVAAFELASGTAQSSKRRRRKAEEDVIPFF
jgi:hypothetical protein